MNPPPALPTTTSSVPAPHPPNPPRPASQATVQSYHASLTNHLKQILTVSYEDQSRPDLLPGCYSSQVKNGSNKLPGKTIGPGGVPTSSSKTRMYTDLKALAERDKEHLNAWYLEGYKRYVGGVDRGFMLLRTPDRDPDDDEEEDDEDEVEEEDEVRLDERTMTGMKRKRRYTEEPGMLERRRKVLRAALAEGANAMALTTTTTTAGEQHPTAGSLNRPSLGGRRPSSLDRTRRRESGTVLGGQIGGSSSTQSSRPVIVDNQLHQSTHNTSFDLSSTHDEDATGMTYISPLITPGLAFIPTVYGEISPMSYSTGQGVVGPAGAGTRASTTAKIQQASSLVGSGFNLVQPPLNRGMMEERKRRARLAAAAAAVTAAVAAAASSTTVHPPPPPPHARFEVPTQLTMTNNASVDFARPEMRRISTSAGSLAFVSANQLPIPLPAVGSSPMSVGQQHHHHQQQHQQYRHQHQHQHTHSHASAADAALGTSSSAGLTSLTGASLGCLSVKLHDCMTGSSSGLGATSSLIMTDADTPARQYDDDDEDHHHVEPFEDAPTPDLLPSFGMGEEMMLEFQGNPGDAVEMSGADSAAKSTLGGLGLSSTYDNKTRPSLLQRATSSYNKWSLATPTSEGNTPMDVAWDKWLRADEGSSTPGQYEETAKGK